MKKIQVFLLFTLSLTSFAQTTKDPYIPVLVENKVWYTAERMEFGDYWIIQYHVGGTEIINGIEYTKILNQEDAIYDYLREDTVERKIYRRSGSTEYELYDFSLEVGDTFYMLSPNLVYTVDAIEYIETLVGPRRSWLLSSPSGELTPVWIEGIGSMAGLLDPQYQPNLNWWGFPELLCFKKEGVMEYKSENGENLGCELESIGIKEQSDDLQLKIIPNPTSGIFSIMSPQENPLITVTILNSLGEMLFKL